MWIIHEDKVEERQQPGRLMKWLAGEEGLQAENLSVCMIRVAPGETVRPAHSHPKSEELIYIISGEGSVMIDSEVGQVKTGSAVLFPQGKIHMLKNTGNREMKVICFFAPATSLDNYKVFPAIRFPE